MIKISFFLSISGGDNMTQAKTQKVVSLLVFHFEKKYGPGGIRTRDLQLRRLSPYPGWATGPKKEVSE